MVYLVNKQCTLIEGLGHTVTILAGPAKCDSGLRKNSVRPAKTAGPPSQKNDLFQLKLSLAFATR